MKIIIRDFTNNPSRSVLLVSRCLLREFTDDYAPFFTFTDAEKRTCIAIATTKNKDSLRFDVYDKKL